MYTYDHLFVLITEKRRNYIMIMKQLNVGNIVIWCHLL